MRISLASMWARAKLVIRGVPAINWGYLDIEAEVFDPYLSKFLKPEMIHIRRRARLDAFVRVEGGQGVTIGEYAHISSFSSLNAGGGKLVFGAHSGCACGVRIASGMPDSSYLEICPTEPPDQVHVIRKRTVIGQYVVIYSNAVICPGVTVGDGAIIGAGAVVTHDVPDFAVVAGVPAQVIRYREVETR